MVAPSSRRMPLVEILPCLLIKNPTVSHCSAAGTANVSVDDIWGTSGLESSRSQTSLVLWTSERGKVVEALKNVKVRKGDSKP